MNLAAYTTNVVEKKTHIEVHLYYSYFFKQDKYNLATLSGTLVIKMPMLSKREARMLSKKIGNGKVLMPKTVMADSLKTYAKRLLQKKSKS